MLVPSTFTGWYRKIMMNAEIASETSRSRAQIATTGNGCAANSFASSGVVGSGLTTSGIAFTFYPTFCSYQTEAFVYNDATMSRPRLQDLGPMLFQILV